MKVKALFAHCNGYGDNFEKAAGEEYDLPDEHAGPLIDAGLAEEVRADGEAPSTGAKVRGAKG